MKFFVLLLVIGVSYAFLVDEWVGFDISPPLTPEQKEEIHRIEEERLSLVPVNITSVLDVDDVAAPAIPARRLKRVQRLLSRARALQDTLKDAGSEYLAQTATIKKILEDVVDLTPQLQEGFTELGTHLCVNSKQESDVIQALKMLGMGVARNPNNGTALSATAHCMWSIGLHLEAIKFFTAATERDNQPEYWHFLCTAKKHRFGTTAALECFETAIGKFPSEAPIQINLGVGQFHQGLFLNATKTLKNALATSPTSAGVHGYLGFSHWYLGEYELALKHISTANELSPKEKIYAIAHVQALRSLNRYEEASEMLKAGVKAGMWPRADQYAITHYNDLVSKPWFQPKKLNITRVLEDSVEIIKSEAILVLDKLTPRTAPVVQSGVVKSFLLIRNGQPWMHNCELLPKTCDILVNQTESVSSTGNSYLTQYSGGAHLHPTVSQNNIILRAELPLSGVPSKEAKLRVGTETRDFTEGRPLFFDPSFEHEFWAPLAQESLFLTVETFHPELNTKDLKTKAIQFVTRHSD